MKITFILESSYNSGGMERMLSTIANALADTYEVTVVTAFNNGRKDFFPLSEKIIRVDLGIKMEEYTNVYDLKRDYKGRLSTWLTTNPQNIAISLGSLEFFFLAKIKDGSKKIFWYHFAINYNELSIHGLRYKSIARLIGLLKKWRMIFIASKYDKVVVLSKNDLKEWRRYINNVSQIYNPITITPKKVTNYGVKRAIAVGRIDYQKGYEYLIEAWKIVHKEMPEWKIDIYGNGNHEYVQFIQNLIDSHKLNGIVNLAGTTDKINEEYSAHSIMILSSRYEGFGLALIEAAACGLPLISFDCEQGPSEIINDGKNGFLISPVGDIEGLANAIIKLAKNEKLRNSMGSEAMEMASMFSMDKIKKSWLELLDVF